MINSQKLYPIWPPEIYSYYEYINVIRIYFKNKCITICNDFSYQYVNKNWIQRKNCVLTKSKSNGNITILFHEDYIKSIIRSRYLNYLIND
jgi:hypothetical protein